MNMRPHLPTFCLLAAVLVGAGNAGAQTSCDGKQDVSLNQWIPRALALLSAPDAVASAPQGAPSDEQVTAVAAAGESTSLVQGASFPALLGLAAEYGLATTADGKITVNVSPFDVLAAFDPDVIDKQSRYEKHAGLRRVGAAVTLGGKGDEFDRDGDGAKDPALEASDLGDIVGWEVRVRVFGTRDRREIANYSDSVEAFRRVVGREFEKEAEAFDAVVGELRSQVARDPELFVSQRNSSCFDSKAFDKLLAENTGLRARLERLSASNEALTTAGKKASAAMAAEADRRAVWSLFVGGLERQDDFGPDKQVAGVRGALGAPDRNMTFNLEWNRTRITAGDDPETLKAGLELSRLVLKGSALSAEGIDIAISGVYERYRNVPGAENDTNAKVSAKLELPIATGIALPMSVTWANHANLLEDESEFSGHLGFTFDLSQAKKFFSP